MNQVQRLSLVNPLKLVILLKVLNQQELKFWNEVPKIKVLLFIFREAPYNGVHLGIAQIAI